MKELKESHIMINHHHTENNLLKIDRSITIHHRNIRALAIKIYKVMQGISLPLSNEVFVPRQLCNYELCGNNFLERSRA